MRRFSFPSLFLAGVTALGATGCTSSGPQTAASKNAFSEWPGAKALVALGKSNTVKAAPLASDGALTDQSSLKYKTAPPGADLFVASAHVYEKTGNEPAARDQYERALKASPDYLPALVGYAHLLDRAGKLEEAARYYQKAAEKHPQDPAVHNDLGLCYARRGLLREATLELTRAVELQPAKQLYRNNLATVLVEQDRVPEAIDHLTSVNGPAIAHYNVGFLLKRKGNAAAAADHFARAAQLDPALAVARQELNAVASQSPAEARLTQTQAVAPQSPRERGADPADDSIRASAVWPASSRGPSLGLPGSAYDAPRGDLPPTPDQASAYAPDQAPVSMLPPVEDAPPRY